MSPLPEAVPPRAPVPDQDPPPPEALPPYRPLAENEISVGWCDREIPVGKCSNESRLARDRPVSDEQPLRQRLLVFCQPDFKLKSGRLKQRQVTPREGRSSPFLMES
jgi:hypothetical protein